MNKKRIYAAIEGALVADAYALGAHWIYQEDQLLNLPIDWNTLNSPQAMWHKGKEKGDFTHYGDHTLWLYEFITQTNGFIIEAYRDFWCHKMESYTGYIDGSSRDTLAHLKHNPSDIHGSTSHDLSIIGRIAPLLLVSNSKHDFLHHVEKFISFTHNSPMVKDAGKFFGSLLFEVVNGSSLSDAIATETVPDSLSLRYQQALESQGKDPFTTIRAFGPACGIEGGFEGVIHILTSYTDYKEALIANTKAGGDNAARGMIIGMLLGAEEKEIPIDWKRSVKHLPSFQ